jgi:hypothetical protein
MEPRSDVAVVRFDRRISLPKMTRESEKLARNGAARTSESLFATPVVVSGVWLATLDVFTR